MNSYFTEEFIRFFKDLSKHNNREWFEKNKDRYTEHVKIPFHSFIEELIVRMHFEDERINIEAKDAIFRIYRDIRFSKDKTPYKTHASALISPFGRKDLELPGFYFELSHKEAGIYGGAYMIERPRLKKLRRYIIANRAEFAALQKDKNFVKHFSGLRGDKAIRLDKEFQETLQVEPLIANKQFYYGAELKSESILDPKFPDSLMKYVKAGMKMSLFLEDGLKG
jgi:uncharacterized protein (TIGR02453 family)